MDSVLELSPGCDYLFVDGPTVDSFNNALPTISESLAINGNGATLRRDPSLTCTFDDGASPDEFRLARVADGVEVDLRDLTVRNFCSSSDGGVLAGANQMTVNVDDCTFEDNVADGDGGVFESNIATYTFRNSAFRRNVADFEGGAAEATVVTFDVEGCEFVDNTASEGGVFGGSTPTYRILGSTFLRNVSNLRGGALTSSGGPELVIVGSTFADNETGGDGGAIRTNFDPGMVINILNSTFVGNRAGTDGTGQSGAIHFDQTGPANITNSTFYDNTDAGGYAFNLTDAPVIALKNSILDNPSSPLCTNGTFAVGRENLLSDDSCDPAGDLDFNLGSVTGLATMLADNGGATPTLALMTGSNAIDAVIECTAASGGVNPVFSDGDPVAADQRGGPRPQGTTCDVGAFEFVVPFVAPVPTLSGVGLGFMAVVLLAVASLGVTRPGRAE